MRWTTVMITLGLILGIPTLAHAQEDEDEIGFDDLEEPEKPEPRGWQERIHISGRFDLNLEMSNFGDGESLDNFKNYHHFVFLKATPNEKVTLNAEILDLAQAGAICLVCGGLHISTIDLAILARVAAMPWCLCGACQVCTPFRRELDRLMERTNLFGSGLT